MRRFSISPAAVTFLFSLFAFISGFCSLVYQVVWLRMAFSYFGILTPVLSVVISTFMLGLGLGSWLGGRWAGETTASAPSRMRAYGFVELSIALSAALPVPAFRWGSQLLGHLGAMNSGAYLASSGLIIVLALLPATFAIGVTVPVMMSFFSAWHENRDRETFSFLYVANVLGALTGVLGTAYVLIELLGFRRTVDVAIAGNLAIAFAAMLASARLSVDTGTIEAPLQPALVPIADKQVRVESLTVLFLTGFLSMGSEVIWTRGFAPVLGNTIYSFAAVVAIYLAATYLGVLLYRFSLGVARPALARALPLLTMATLGCAFLPAAAMDPRIARFIVQMADGTKILFPILGVFPVCVVLGALTPLLIDRFSGGNPRQAGLAYAANVAGCVLGPLLTAYLLLPHLGTRLSTMALSLCFGAWLIVAALKKGQWSTVRWSAGILSAGLLIGSFLGSIEESFPFQPRFVRRDYAATVVFGDVGMQKQLMVNGTGITALTPITKSMAHLPIMAFPGTPGNALVICFGMGTTYRSLLLWGIPTTAVELVPSVRDSFPYFFADAPEILSNPKGRIVIDDGRRFLARTAERYDVITLDPPPPVEASGSGLLYSREFYRLVDEHLTDAGVLQQWWPGGEPRILNAVAGTLRASFPYVRVFKGFGGFGFHFLASRHPIELKPIEAFITSMPDVVRADILAWSPGDLPTVLTHMTMREVPLSSVAGEHPALLTDDAPFNEYFFLRRFRNRHRH